MKLNETNIKNVPDGVYIITTLSEKEYMKKVPEIKKVILDKKIKTNDEFDKIVQRNLKLCSMTFKVHRTTWDKKVIKVFMNENVMIPHIIIDEFFDQTEGKRKFPEFFL